MEITPYTHEGLVMFLKELGIQLKISLAPHGLDNVSLAGENSR